MSDYLPAEVIEEILLGLPAKSVLRFRSVCKTWYSLISNSRFAKAYLARSNERSSPYFLFGRFGYEKEIFSLHSNPAIDDSSDFIEFDHPYDIGDIWSWTSVCKIVGSVNGLICFVDSHHNAYEKYFLWNPSVNRSVRLPLVTNLDQSPYVYCLGFGYHAPTNEYKVVRIMYLDDDSTPLAEIYALNTREWHRFTFPPSASFIVQQATVSVSMNGALHWLAQNFMQDTYHNFILSFDLGDEIVYHEIPVPKVLEIEGDQYSLEGGQIAMLNGLLALHGGHAEKYDVWVMKEYGVVESWTKLYSFDFSVKLGRVIGFKKNGEVLIITSNGKDLLSYEPSSQSTIWNLQKNDISSCFYLDNYVEILVLFDAMDGVYEQEKYDVKVERALKIRKMHNS
nr:F-box/kelch-repeat protein At3g23880-like [Quercus suber]POF07476.1 f-box/kelch-repeat protein [Quercus suber]